MLDHQKIVLEAVSNNSVLFKKELKKSMEWLKREERSLLIKWVKEHFYSKYSKMIDEICLMQYNFAS